MRASSKQWKVQGYKLPAGPPEGAQLHLHLDLSPVRPVLDSCLTGLSDNTSRFTRHYICDHWLQQQLKTNTVPHKYLLDGKRKGKKERISDQGPKAFKRFLLSIA